MSDARARRDADRTMRRLGPGLYPAENDSGRCRAPIRIYIGQARAGGTWLRCSKRARAGCLTCWHHRHMEERPDDEPMGPGQESPAAARGKIYTGDM